MTRVRSITTGHLVLIVAVAALALVMLSVLPLRMATDSLELQSRNHVSEFAQTNALAISGQLEGARELVTGYANDVDASGSSAEVGARLDLENLRAVSPDLRTAAFVDLNGDVTSIASDLPSTPINVADREYFRRALQQVEPYTSGVFVSRQQTSQRVIVISKGIRDDDGVVKGVLVGSIDARLGFERWVESASELQRIGVVVYDAEGGVIAGFDPNTAVPTQQQLKDDYVSALAPVDGTEWAVGAYVSRSVAFQAVEDLRSRTYLLTSILGFVILVGVYALTREMRARGRAEEHLSQTEAHMSDVLEAAEQMIFELEIDGRVIACNRSVKTITGFDSTDLVGRYIWEVVVAESDRDRVERVFERLVQSPDPGSWRHRAEGRMVARNTDKELAVEANLWTVRVNGALRVYLLINDISKRKRLERDREAVLLQQRRLVEELRQTDKTKSDFVSTVSHELRTPLTSIVGYLEMLQEGYGGELNEQQESMLGVVDRNSRRLLGLIEDLLTLSRIESGKLRMEHFDLDVGHLVMNAVQAMIPSATEKALEISIDIDPESGVVFGDQNQLERVLLNLLTNAIKFTPEGGSIAVRATNRAGGVVLEVVDTGIGISAEEQTRLFTRFFRSSEVQEMAIQGTGLGLAIVKSIVALHDGRVTVESQHGEGTTVRVWLPVSRVHARS